MHTIRGARPDVFIFVYLEPVRNSRVNLNHVFLLASCRPPTSILVGGPVFKRRYWPYFRSALTSAPAMDPTLEENDTTRCTSALPQVQTRHHLGHSSAGERDKPRLHESQSSFSRVIQPPKTQKVGLPQPVPRLAAIRQQVFRPLQQSHRCHRYPQLLRLRRPICHGQK